VLPRVGNSVADANGAIEMEQAGNNEWCPHAGRGHHSLLLPGCHAMVPSNQKAAAAFGNNE
ncbi:MAG: hypothetical protein JXA69_09975, partial [Phycisphaerae bacterium]|nr:hypothetical protein [Phycisphaerae bacterium]